MRNCNIHDCAAIMKYLAFLEEELRKPDHTLDEFRGARILDEIRTHGQQQVGPSFAASLNPDQRLFIEANEGVQTLFFHQAL